LRLDDVPRRVAENTSLHDSRLFLWERIRPLVHRAPERAIYCFDRGRADCCRVLCVQEDKRKRFDEVGEDINIKKRRSCFHAASLSLDQLSLEVYLCDCNRPKDQSLNTDLDHRSRHEHPPTSEIHDCQHEEPCEKY